MVDTIRIIVLNNTIFLIPQIWIYVLGFFYLISIARYLVVDGFDIL